MKRVMFLMGIATMLIVSCSDYIDKKVNNPTVKKNLAPVRFGDESDIDDMNLYGNVESMTRTYYKFVDNFGELTLEERKSRTYIFNDNGDVIDYVRTKKGDFQQRILYEYNDYGYAMQSMIYSYDNSLSSQKIYQYDSVGNLISKTTYDCWGTIKDKYVYTHDSNGFVIQEVRYNADGSRSSIQKFVYNRAGNLLEECYYDDSNLIYKAVYEYDSNANRIKKSNYSYNYLNGYSEYKYDSAGNIIREIEYEGGYCRKILVYKYDALGNRVEIKEYNDLNELQNTQCFKYDKLGNVVEEIIYKGEAMIPHSVAIYNIKYF